MPADDQSRAFLPMRPYAALTRMFSSRQHIAVQAGSRFARIMLARREGRSLRIERLLVIDLQANGLLTPGELATHLRGVLATLPTVPVTVTLQPGRTHSQVLELKPGDPLAAEWLAQAVGGRQFDQILSVYDARPLRPFPGHPHPQWVTIARDADVTIQLMRCGLDPERTAHVVSADAALVAAYNATSRAGDPTSAVLVEIGSDASTLVVIEEGQGVFAANFDLGTASLIAALAVDLDCSLPEAERILVREGAAASGPATPRLVTALARWRNAFENVLKEHARETGRSPEPLLAHPRRFSGALLANAGIRALFASTADLVPVQDWPDVPSSEGEPVNASGCAIACGATAIGLDLAPTSVDLLPATSRTARSAARRIGWLHVAGLAIAATGLLFAANTLWQRSVSIEAKETRLELLQRARDAGPQLTDTLAARDQAYREAVPLLYFQKRTRDFVAATRLLREQRKHPGFWFALVADSETYHANSLPRGTPAATPETQLLRNCLARPTGLVVELSLAPGGGDQLGKISTLVTELRASPLFSGVDILPARARQSLADRSVFSSGDGFALSLETPTFEHFLPPPATPGTTSGGLFAQ